MSDALHWPIKSTLVAYVRSRDDGSIETDEGAELLETGAFRFPLVDVTDAPFRMFRFRGGVRLRAHTGLLDVSLSDPWVEVSSAPSISAVVEWTDQPERLEIARIGVIQEQSSHWLGTAVRLSADGALTLGALQYYEGQQIDDLGFTAPRTA